MAHRTEVLQIEGMSCAHCVRAVRDALGEVEGVAVDDVSQGSATVRYDPEEVSRAQLAEAIDEAGYTLRPAEAAA